MWGVTSTCWLTDWVTLSRFHLHQSSWTGQSELRNVQCFYSSNCDTCIDQPLTRPSTSQPRPRWDEDALLVLTLRTASTNPRNFNDLLPTLYCLWDLRKMQKQLLNCSVLFLTFPCCCGSWSEGHVVIPATTEMTTRMVTRAWLMSSMLLQWDRLKCWHSGLHFDHQNWLESWQPAVICNDLQLISLKTFPSPWSTETAACTAVSVLVQQQSFCLIFKLNECYPAGLSTGPLFIGSAWFNSENLLDD